MALQWHDAKPLKRGIIFPSYGCHIGLHTPDMTDFNQFGAGWHRERGKAMTKTERMNYHYMADAMRRLEWDLHQTILSARRVPPEWHEYRRRTRPAQEGHGLDSGRRGCAAVFSARWGWGMDRG